MISLGATHLSGSRGRIYTRPLSLHVRDSSYPSRRVPLDTVMLRTFFRQLAARLRGAPPPISDVDVRRATHALASASPEEKRRAREAARRALDAASGAAGPPHGTDTSVR
jgi:hypothetical protein